MNGVKTITKSAIFLDRDGVINRERSDYVKSIAEFEFLPGATQALKQLNQLPWPIIIITNQAGIGRGIITETRLNEIHAYLLKEVALTGGRIDAIYHCPHTPQQQCSCRKPRPGLFLRAAQDLHIDLSRSFMIGDAEKDLLAAHAAGCYPIFVQTGLSNELPGHLSFPTQSCANLTDAVAWLIQHIRPVYNA